MIRRLIITANYSTSSTVRVPLLQTRTTTIGPASVGGKVRLTLTQLSLSANGYDKLTIYDGPDTNSPVTISYTSSSSIAGPVTATNPTGQLTLKLTRYLPASPPVTPAFAATISCFLGVPNLTSFTPTSGVAGTSVVITGLNFTGTTAVAFNGVSAPGFVVNSNTQLTVPVPAGATTGLITVTNNVGTGRSSSSFTVLPLIISSFTPTTGAAGTSVVITGLKFTGTTAVRFNGTLAPGFVVNSDTQLTVSVPAGATTGPISVTNALGTGTSASSFLLAPPTISSFTPTSGLLGASVVITGTSFLQASAVRFNGTAASGFVVNSDTQITVNVPAGATTGPLSVTTPSGTGTSAASFTVLVPVISSFTPTSGLVGTSVVITGLNFTGATAVRFNGTAAAGFTVNSDTQLTVSVPAGASTGPLSVTTPTGTGTSATSFTVLAPTISSFSPTSGTAGTSVVITGTNFTGTTAVRFNGLAASGFVVNSDTQITVNVPAGALSGPLSVTTPSGTGTSTGSFTVLVPAISSFTPTSGGQGVFVTIAGANFTGTTAVRFNGALAPGFVVNSDTQLTVSVPAGASTGPLSVTTPTGTGTSTGSFTVLVPVISSFTPTSGTGGTSVVITGANFTGTTAVAFNGTAAVSFVVNSDTQVTAIVAAGTISGFITVTNGIGTATSASNFVTGLSQVPLLTSVSPARNLPTAPQRANVVLTFSQPIAASTAGNVRVFGSQRGGQLVRGGNATASGNTITVDPALAFAPGERVMVTVPATVQSTAGYSTLARVHEFTAAAAGATGTFLNTPTVLTMGGMSATVAVGDLNGDGLQDVVTSDFYGTTTAPNQYAGVVVRLGVGGGQFGPANTYYGASNPGDISLGDIDGDGDLDIVVPSTDNGNVSTGHIVNTLLNDSQGYFTPVSRYIDVSTSPTHAVLGDVDGDGDLDMLIAASTASVSFNNGSGTFTDAYTAASSIATTYAAADVALADVDGDGDLDALIANGSQVSVRLNNGSGSFGGGTDVPVGGPTTKLVVGDVNGDGYLDLATVSASAGSMSVRLNLGNGTFGNGADYPLSFLPSNLALGDINGDGYLDLAAAGYTIGNNYPGQAAVRFNTGNGTFSGGSDFASGGSRASVALGDLDGDGTLDLLTGHTGYVTGYYNSYTPRFSASELYIRFNTARPPTVAGFSPQSGPAGTPVTITGTNLGAVRGVRFGGSAELAPITAQSATSLTVLVPVGAATGALTITSAQGIVLGTATAFTYTPRPAGLVTTLSTAGPLDVCNPRTLTATAASPAFALPAASFGANTSSNVRAVKVQPDGKLVLGGVFTSFNGTTVGRLVRLNPDGSPDAVFNTNTGAGFNNNVRSIALQPDGKILVGGTFTTFNGTAVGELARLNSDGTLDTSFNANIGSGFSGEVWAPVVDSDGKILVGGTFTSFNGATVGRLVRLNPNGTLDAGFKIGSGFDLDLLNLALQPDGKILALGTFSSFNATAVGQLVRLNPSGSLDASFSLGSNFLNVRGLAVQANGQVLVSGTRAGATFVLRFNSNGTQDTGFNAGGTGFRSANASTSVYNLVVQPDGQILAGGDFATYNGGAAPLLVRLNPDGSRDTNFNANASFVATTSFVQSLAVQADGQVLVVGTFDAYNGVTGQNKVVRLNPDGSLNTAPTPVSGASFTFTPGNTTTNPLVTSTAGSYTVVASLNGAVSNASNTVTLTACSVPGPTVTALSASAELPGMPVTLTGTGFAAGSTVSFGGVAAASVTMNSTTSLTAVVPASAAPGSSAVVVATPGAGSSATAPPFTVLEVYNGGALNACAAAVAPTASVGDGDWHYLLSSGGQVVAAYSYTGASLGSFSLEVLRADPAQPVRQDGRGHWYLDRNWHLTASGGRFDGRSVTLRLYGLTTESGRLQTADPSATMANLKASQYSGANEDCALANNDPAGESRLLSAAVTSPAGTSWFAAKLVVPDHFSEFYLTGSSTPLPVELTDFTARAEGSAAVRLAWTTASEKNSDRFEVERSRDGRTFERIGQVAAAGNSASPHSYAYLDSQIPQNLNSQALYYRLRQVDLDGNSSYSPVRAVARPDLGSLTLYPNPARTAVAVAGAPAGAGVEVLDALGRRVASATADAAGTAALTLPAGLAAGMYVVRCGSQTQRLAVTD